MRTPLLNLFALLLLTAGCVQLPKIEPLSSAPLRPEVRLLVARTQAELRELVANPEDWALTDGLAKSAIDQINTTTLAAISSSVPGPSTSTLALGVTLRLCASAVERFRLGFADSTAAQSYVRGRFSLTCLLPLATLQALG